MSTLNVNTNFAGSTGFGIDHGTQSLDFALNKLSPWSSGSSSAMGTYNSEPIGDTYRGLGADWFNADNVAREDFYRNEQAANNQLARDNYLYEKEKAFVREQMAWEKQLSDTSYQRAVADLKKAGLNPTMAISQGGASSLTAPSASVSSSRGGYSARGTNSNTGQLITAILSLVGGIYGQAAASAASILNASTAANARVEAAKIYKRG